MIRTVEDHDLVYLENSTCQSGVLNGRVYTYNRALFEEFGRYLLHILRMAFSWLISYEPEKNILKKPCAQLDVTTLKNYFEYVQKEAKGTFLPVLPCLSVENLKDAQRGLKLGGALREGLTPIINVENKNKIQFVSIPVIVDGREGDHIVSLFIDKTARTITFFDSKGLSLEDKKNARAKEVYQNINLLLDYGFEENRVRYQHIFDGYNCGAFVAMYTKMRVLGGPVVGGEMNVIDFRHQVMTKDLEGVSEQPAPAVVPDCQFPRN